MACHLIAPDKHSGEIPVGIGETVRHTIAKPIMTVTGDQAKMAYRNLKLCAGLETGIWVATHAMAQTWQDRNAQ